MAQITMLALLWTVLACLGVAQAAPSVFAASQRFHPVVIWHGLGDSAYAEGMQSLADELRNAFPGMFVHLVSLADDVSADQRAGFFGNVNDQVQQVCGQLAGVEELRDGFDAVGFSQGGQFLRAYVERCNTPPVRNLVTFGSQHMGISDFPACRPNDLLCRLTEGALRGGIYSQYAQKNIVTAQYYRDPTERSRYEKYLDANKFIADINNEVEHNDQYKTNIESLDNLVLLMFDKDSTVEPKQSSWFASYPEAPKESEFALNGSGQSRAMPVEKDVVPLRQSSIYTEDRIGLRTLDKRGALVMELCHGIHMHIDGECSGKVFGQYVGIAPPSSLWPASFRHAWARTVYGATGLRVGATPASIQLLSLLGLVAIGMSLRAAFRTPRQGAVRLA